jgi:hypothetical protein
MVFGAPEGVVELGIKALILSPITFFLSGQVNGLLAIWTSMPHYSKASLVQAGSNSCYLDFHWSRKSLAGLPSKGSPARNNQLGK